MWQFLLPLYPLISSTCLPLAMKQKALPAPLCLYSFSLSWVQIYHRKLFVLIFPSIHSPLPRSCLLGTFYIPGPSGHWGDKGWVRHVACPWRRLDTKAVIPSEISETKHWFRGIYSCWGNGLLGSHISYEMRRMGRQRWRRRLDWAKGSLDLGKSPGIGAPQRRLVLLEQKRHRNRRGVEARRPSFLSPWKSVLFSPWIIFPTFWSPQEIPESLMALLP